MAEEPNQLNYHQEMWKHQAKTPRTDLALGTPVPDPEVLANNFYWADLANSSMQDLTRKIQEGKEYVANREWEAKLTRQGWDEETLGMARSRASKLSSISPRNVLPSYLEEQFSYTPSEISELRSGKLVFGSAEHEAFARHMGETEVIGGYSETGYMAHQAGASYLGTYGYATENRPRGISRYISAEQQAEFIKDLFGITESYTLAETGERFKKENFTRVRILRDIDLADSLTMEKAKEAADRRLQALIRLKRMEQKGKLFHRVFIDHFVNKQRQTFEDEDKWESFLDYLKSNPADVDPDELVDLAPEEVAEKVSLEEMSYQDIEEYEVTPEERLAIREELSRTNISAFEEVGSTQWAAARGETSTTGKVSSFGEERAYRIAPEYFSKRLSKYQKLYNRAFKSKKGPYSEEFIKGFGSGLRSEQQEVLSISGKSYGDIEDFFKMAGPGERIQAGKGNKWADLSASRVSSYEQVLLEDFYGKSVSLASFYDKPSALAMSERFFDVYFRKEKGKPTYGAYTAAGTWIGSTYPQDFVPPVKSKARVYWEPGQGYAAAWGPGIATKGLLELPQSQALYMTGDEAARAKRQENLERIYLQEQGDYSLISRYRLDPETKRYIEVTGREIKNPGIVEEYYQKAFSRAERSHLARERWQRMRVPRAKVDPSLMDKALGWFGGRSDRAKGLIAGGLIASAALLMLKATTSKPHMTSLEDVSGSDYAMSTEDQRIFQARRLPPPPARITPQYASGRGYTTNIDIQSAGAEGLNNEDLARVMDRHARMTLGTTSGKVAVDINDSSDKRSDHDRRRKIANMVGA